MDEVVQAWLRVVLPGILCISLRTLLWLCQFQATKQNCGPAFSCNLPQDVRRVTGRARDTLALQGWQPGLPTLRSPAPVTIHLGVRNTP